MTQAIANRSPLVGSPDDARDTERVPLADPRADVVSIDPQRQSGVPCFVGTRVPIHDLFGYLAGGESLGSFLESFPSVSREQAERVLMLAEDRLFAGLLVTFPDAQGKLPRAELIG